ncbi:MAG: hypothetical protein IPK95_13695 [Cellvibrionales bacterium]|nr:hypothetical protein [Cellvibrionales bacterium]
MLNLLAADSRLRSLPLWNRMSSAVATDKPREDGVDPRYARCQKNGR